MKTIKRLLVLGMALLLSFGLVACAGAAADEPADTETATFSGPEHEIPAIGATFHVPEGYSVSETEDANETLVVSPDADGPEITIQVNEQLYDDVNLSDISYAEAQLYALNAALGFGVADFDVIEEGGRRVFVMYVDRPSEHECRYGTIVDGHMVYVYANTGDEPITEAQRADLESIAMSIRSAL